MPLRFVTRGGRSARCLRILRAGATAAALALGSIAAAAEPPTVRTAGADAAPAASAAAKPLDEDCKAILAKSSHEWTETCANSLGDSTVAIETALARYGDCYDAATDALAAAVRPSESKDDGAASGSPSGRGAPACLPGLQKALEGFTEYALGAALTGGTYSRIATAFATLYEKQFRRRAWEAARAASGGALPPLLTPDEKRLAAARARLTEIVDAATPRLRADLNERFEALLAATKQCDVPPLLVYEFAITILQSPADPPFAPPPF